MRATRLFTVVIRTVSATRPGTDDIVTFYEADIANLHFSRTNENLVKHWVRVAARHIYGDSTQVIFIHEGNGNAH